MNMNRVLQGAILVALIGIGGVLYSIRKHMAEAPAPPPAVQTAAQNAVPPQAAIPAPAPEPAAASPAATPEPVMPASKPAAKSGKPSAFGRKDRVTSHSDSSRQTASAKDTASNTNYPIFTTPQAPPATAEPTPAVAPAVPEPPPPPPVRTIAVPAGTPIAVRLIDAISTDTNHQGDTFQATLDEPLIIDGVTVADRGANAFGRVVQAQQSGRVSGVAEMSIELNRIQTLGGDMRIASDTMLKKADTTRKRDAATIGGMAGIGAIIGGIAGGGAGAGIGAAAGGAAGTGTVLATRGKAASYPPETRLTFRLRAPITVSIDPSRAQTRDDSAEEPSRPHLQRHN